MVSNSYVPGPRSSARQGHFFYARGASQPAPDSGATEFSSSCSSQVTQSIPNVSFMSKHLGLELVAVSCILGGAMSHGRCSPHGPGGELDHMPYVRAYKELPKINDEPWMHFVDIR